MTQHSSIGIMSERQAKAIEHSIIGMCLLALVFVIQPFSQTLYAIGFVLCFIGGLAFNLVPFCQPGKTFRSLYFSAAIVLVVFAVVVAIALGVAELYALSLRN
jgi:hypothetical protein